MKLKRGMGNVICKNSNCIDYIPTSHQIGQKKVLLSNEETPTAVTQIALSKLLKGESVELHVHPTMDEHFLIQTGEGEIQIEGEVFSLSQGVFIVVSAGCAHKLRAIVDLEFISISVAR